jgi:hypothetical protein
VTVKTAKKYLEKMLATSGGEQVAEVVVTDGGRGL